MGETVRIHYFCSKRGCYTTRRGRFIRTFRSKAGRLVLLYFDLMRDAPRHAVGFRILRSSRRTIWKPARFRDLPDSP